MRVPQRGRGSARAENGIGRQHLPTRGTKTASPSHDGHAIHRVIAKPPGERETIPLCFVTLRLTSAPPETGRPVLPISFALCPLRAPGALFARVPAQRVAPCSLRARKTRRNSSTALRYKTTTDCVETRGRACVSEVRV